MRITKDQITVGTFRQLFYNILRMKESAGIVGLQKNPSDLLERAKTYGVHYKNDSWGWGSNIWARSETNSVVVGEEQLRDEHRQLMLNVLEHMLVRPMVQVDANLGSPGSRAEMRCRLYLDPQFPDIGYRWAQLNFPGDASAKPDKELFCIPHYLENPNIGGSAEMLRVLRFPNHGYSIVTVSSYQGEVKKDFLSHWIFHVYNVGGTGEHASLKEFTVKRVDGKKKRIVMGAWGLTGSGKSTHGLYIVDKRTDQLIFEKFGVRLSEFVSDQVLKNDDITAWFEDCVLSPERGAWTKTEGVDENQPAIYRAAMAQRALHENTEWGKDGNVSFAGELFQYRDKPNQNARTVLMMADTGYFDGNVDSTEPPNMAVFITPGYITDYAWIKLNDNDLACKVLADGRTVGHPAQGSKGVAEEKYCSRYCLPFTMGVGCASHMHRFRGYLENRARTKDPIEIYQINTTGRVGTNLTWHQEVIDGRKKRVPVPVFEMVNGKRRVVGGTGPSIEETEVFLHQAARGAVEYEPHPVWGEKVLVPVNVPGISKKRLAEMNPYTYHPATQMKRFLHVQIAKSKVALDTQCAGLDKSIYNAMDF